MGQLASASASLSGNPTVCILHLPPNKYVTLPLYHFKKLCHSKSTIKWSLRCYSMPHLMTAMLLVPQSPKFVHHLPCVICLGVKYAVWSDSSNGLLCGCQAWRTHHHHHQPHRAGTKRAWMGRVVHSGFLGCWLQDSLHQRVVERILALAVEWQQAHPGSRVPVLITGLSCIMHLHSVGKCSNFFELNGNMVWGCSAALQPLMPAASP